MPPRIDVRLGERFGQLLVVSEAEQHGAIRRFRCRCDCGNEMTTRLILLRQGETTSCGCVGLEKFIASNLQRAGIPRGRSHRFDDLSGRRFGRLVVVEVMPGVGRLKWRCRCDCGREAIVQGNHLKRGATQSCGCYQSEASTVRWLRHGEARAKNQTVEYKTWASMIARCANPNTTRYERYGGRGISVCERWRNSYENFLADMGRKPSPKYSIDRINNDGNYEPGNCRWATASQQQKNKPPRPRKAA